MTDEISIQQAVTTKRYLQKFFANGLLYTIELWLLKVAFLGYFYNLRRHFSRTAKILYLAVCVYAGTAFVIVLGLQLGYCRPISRNWQVENPEMLCVSLESLLVSTMQAMMNLSSDILVLIMALVVISSLKLGRRERVALFFVAGIGSVSIIMCTVRFTQVYETIINPNSGTLAVTRELYVWGTLETNFAIAAFCLPAYRVFFDTHFKRATAFAQRSITTIGGSGGKRSRGKISRITVEDTVDVDFHDAHGSQTELNRLKPTWDEESRKTVAQV